MVLFNEEKDSLEGEVWKPIEGVPGYYCSNYGRIRSDRKVIKPQPNSTTGLVQCMVYIDKKPKLLNVHTIVGRTFLGPQPKDGMMIRHKTSDIRDNSVDNLTWAYGGFKRNHKEGITVFGKKPVKRKYRYVVKQKTPTGITLATFIGFEELEKRGFKKYQIMQAADGKYSTSKFYYKKYCWEVTKTLVQEED